MTDDHDFLPSSLQLASVPPYRIPSFDRAGMLRLDVNERPDGAPAHVVAALQKALKPQQIATYPVYAEWLRHAAAEFAVDQTCVVATNGADEGIRAIVDAHLLAGTALVTHAPGFEMFAVAAKLRGNPVVRVPFRLDSPATFSFDPDAWFSALASTEPPPGVVTLANPSNPTGAMVPREFIEKTLDSVSCPVIIDETYGAFLGESCIDLIDRYRHLFVLRSFSKVHGLAGLRIGAIVSRPANIEAMRRLLNPYNVNRAAVAASIACMKHPGETLRHIEMVRAARTELVSSLRAMGFATGAEYANFVLVHVGEDHARITAALRDEQVLIRDRHGSHPDLDGVVRVAIGTSGQMRRVAAAFRKHLRKPPRLDTLLLDMDGTLVDVSTSYRRAIRETARKLLAAHGAGDDKIAMVTDEYVDGFKARGGLNNDWDCTAAICAALGVDLSRETVIDTFQQLYRGTAFDGFIANESWLLSRESAALLPRFSGLAVVTGRPRAEALWTLRKHADGLVQHVVGMEDTLEDKPHPEPLLRGLRQVGGESAAYVGDSVDDMAAAHAAGMFAVGILGPGKGWQSGWPERLCNAGADVVFDTIDSAVAWLSNRGQS